MNTSTYTAENLLTSKNGNDAYHFIRGSIKGAIYTHTLVGKKVLLRNWDSSLDWVYIVCIHLGVIGEEVVTVLYDTDNEVQTMDLGFLTNSIEEVYESDIPWILSIW